MNIKTTLINNIVNKFNLFPDDEIELYSPIEEKNILWFEDKFQLRIPQEYKEFLKYSNGLYLSGYVFLGIVQGTDRAYGLDSIYDFEHYEAGNEMPKTLLPFSPDGFGNHYCLDIRNGNVVFWEHDLDYTKTFPEIIASSFFVFLENIINEALKAL